MCGGEERLKILVITVAGMSSRFSESLGYPCLKCLYHEGGIEASLLYRILHQNTEFDRYVIVGGFMYEELEKTVAHYFNDLKEKIILVKNEHYADYGSCYSLYLALREIQSLPFDEVVFAEGDLYVDRESFKEICDKPGNIITCNQEAILASKAVAFYFDEQYGIHYIYDTSHSALEIPEPFLGIFNSGQIWKFADRVHLKKVTDSIGEDQWRGTNLVIIQRYFGNLGREQYDMVMFREWVNCNTILDYRRIRRHSSVESEYSQQEM